MLVSKKAKTMPPCKDTDLFETMQYGVHRILTREQVTLLVSNVVQSKMFIYDNDN